MGNCCLTASKSTMSLVSAKIDEDEAEIDVHSQNPHQSSSKESVKIENVSIENDSESCCSSSKEYSRFKPAPNSRKEITDQSAHIIDSSAKNKDESPNEFLTNGKENQRRKSHFCPENEDLQLIVQLTNSMILNSNDSLKNNKSRAEERRFDSILNFVGQDKDLPKKINLKQLFKNSQKEF